MITPSAARLRAERQYEEQLRKTEEDIDARMREHGGSVMVYIRLCDAVNIAFNYAAAGWDVDVDHLLATQTELRFRPANSECGVVRRAYRGDGVVTHEELPERPKVYAAHGGWADEASSPVDINGAMLAVAESLKGYASAARRAPVGQTVSDKPIVVRHDGGEA